MAIIKCKMCGGDLVIEPGSTVAECEYCGSRQTVPVADNEKKLTLFARANRLRSSCEFDKAAGIYEAIVADFPEEAESYWGLVLCKYGIEYVDDPATGKKIPTCHRSSFDSVMDDSNFEQAMENADEVALRVYRQEAKQIEEIRKGILEVSSTEKPYDIFICYKETDSNGDRTVDSLLAQDIYDALTSKGYRVFFSRITLEDKLGQAYEPYIFAALNSAKIMLAVGTCYEHYNAVWVKNEWSRYLKIIAQDKNKYLIPCYKGLDAYDIPKEFAHLQGQDMGKVGAIADLLRGIEKLMPRQNSNTVVAQEKVVVGNAGGSNKIASLLDRGNMALEDGDWAKADSFFEDVLNNDSKNAQAYIGKTLAQERCRTMDALVRKRRDVYQNVSSEKLHIQEKSAHISEMAEQYSLPGYVEQASIRELYRFDLSYTSEVSGRQKQYREEENWWQNHRWLSRAEKFAMGAVAETIQNEKKHLFAQLNDRVKKAQEADVRSIAKLEAAYDAYIVEADKRAEQLYNDGLIRREKDYQIWLEQAKKETNPNELKKLAQRFEGLADYQDSRNLAGHCRKRAEDEQAKIDAEKERQRKLDAEKRAIEDRKRAIEEKKRQEQEKRKKKFRMIMTACAFAVLLLAVIGFKILADKGNYQKAAELQEKGQKLEAALRYSELGDYQDAQARSFALWGEITLRETVSAGSGYSVAVRKDGTVVAVGRNDFGQCNVSEWTDIVAVSAGTTHTVGLKSDGTVVAVGENVDGRCDVSSWRDVVAISAGSENTVGLRSNGTVVAVGLNDDGRCNVSSWQNIIAVNAYGHTVGLKADGTVVARGADLNNRCDVHSLKNIVAIDTGWRSTIGLKSDGSVSFVGWPGSDQMYVKRWKNITAISSLGDDAIGLKSDGTVVLTEDYDTSNWKSIVAVTAGFDHYLGLKADGTIVAVGNNDYGQCDVSQWDNILFPVLSPEQQLALEKAKAKLVAEQERMAEKYASAEVLASQGETGKAAIQFAKLGDYRDARERSFALWDTIAVQQTVDTGRFHSVAVKTDGTVVSTKYTENNQYNCGQCEVSGWTDIIAVSTTEGHTVGLKADGTVVATKYTGKYYNDQCEVSDWRDVTAISTGNTFTVGLNSDHTVLYAGGKNITSDWTDIVAISGGYSHVVGLKADGTVVAAGDNRGGQCDVTEWKDVVAVSAGWYHTVGLKSDGSVVTVGSNSYKECDVSDWKDIVAISAGHMYTVGLKSDGTVVVTGRNDDGQCNVSGWRDIVAISAELGHTVGLKKDGTVVAVGNSYGNRCDVSGWRHIKLP